MRLERLTALVAAVPRLPAQREKQRRSDAASHLRGNRGILRPRNRMMCSHLTAEMALDVHRRRRVRVAAERLNAARPSQVRSPLRRALLGLGCREWLGVVISRLRVLLPHEGKHTKA